MKKIIVLVLGIFLLFGCTNVRNLEIEEVLSLFSEEIKNSDIYRVGYKFYLPNNMQIYDSGDFTEIIKSDGYTYYLYIDVVSHYYSIGNYYEETSEAFYSKKFEINGKIGYIEIEISENDKYLIEIMYNYAKIEVMVNDEDINVALVNCINILNNVVFTDIIIENYFGEDVLNYNEEIFDIFKTNEEY